MKRKKYCTDVRELPQISSAAYIFWKAAHHFVHVCRDVVSLEVVIVINNSIICGIIIVKLLRQSSNHHNAEGS